MSRPEPPRLPPLIEPPRMSGASADARFTAFRRRTVADDRPFASRASAVDGAPVWVSGLLAGLQGAVLSLLVVVLPTLAAYVATSADPTLSGVGWWRSVAVGTGLWLLGHGSHLVADGATVTITPLGLTALAVFTCYASARRSARSAWSGWAAGTGGYAALAALLTLTQTTGPGPALRAALGAAAVAAVGLGAGILARPDSPPLRDLAEPLWRRVPAAARAGAVAGAMALALVVTSAALVSAVWAVQGRTAIAAIVDGLELDAVGAFALALGQLAVLPNLVVWALAWLAGPGFSIGQGSIYSPTELVGTPLPALPIMGALPARVESASAPELVPLLLVLIGALAGWYLSRRLIRGTWRTPLLAVLTGAATTWFGSFVLLALAGGSAGPGRLAVVGADLGRVPVLIAGEVALGLLLVAVPRNPEFRAVVRRGWYRLAGRGSSEAQPVGDGAGAVERVH